MAGEGVPESIAPCALEPLARDLRNGKLPLHEFIITTLDRIDSIEAGIMALLPEPRRRERLLAQASALEKEFPHPGKRPPLFGVLLGVKDLFAADGFETRAGSRLPPSLFAMDEGPVVVALKEAGALVLGKTVSTEFAYFSPGPTRNPWNTAHTPGGSSSGSAAAVVAGYCPLAIGTQTIGSISRPAAFCGVAGWKPSYERTSRKGAVAFSPSLDHVGLFASDASGLAFAAPIVTSSWSREAFDQARCQMESRLPILAVAEGSYLDQADPDSRILFEAQTQALAAAGFTIIRLDPFSNIQKINERHRRIAAAELERVHRTWFAAYREFYSATTAEMILKGAAIGDEQLAEDILGLAVLRRHLDAALSASGASFWLSPAALGPAPLGIGNTGSPIMNLPWTHAGVPTLTIPAGFAQNHLPLGLQLAGRFGGDEELLALGIHLEKLIK